MNKIYKIIISGLFLFILTISCVHMRPAYQPPQELEKPKLYTAYNMWYEKPDNMYCLNYQIGTLLPAGTEVENIKVVRHQPESEMGRPFVPNITFKVVSTGQRYKVKYKQKFHPNRSVKEYGNLMFTENTFEDLTEGMSEKEIDAVKSGSLVRGMSKKAVIVAVGVPSDHRTPSQESNTWVYWTNRFQSKKICFTSKNVTEQCNKIIKDVL